MNRAIFLDIDGVLNSETYFKERDRANIGEADFLEFNLDSSLISKLNNIIEKTNAIIVLSSSWRVYGLDRVNRALKNKGFKFQINHMTRHPSNLNRGEEILEVAERYNILEYVVIDDDSFDIVEYIEKERFINTTWARGLEDAHCEYIINIFERGF